MANTFSGGAAISVERVTTASPGSTNEPADNDDDDRDDEIEQPFQ